MQDRKLNPRTASAAGVSPRTRRSAVARARRGGSVIVMAGLSIVVLLGLVGLVMDGGNLMATRRRAQNAADSAALAGAVALKREASAARATADALQYAQENGFANTGPGSIVKASSPPASGPHAGNAKCVQVTIYKEFPSYFIRVLTRRQPSVTAQAVATIETGTRDGDGLICLHPDKNAALSMTDDASINVTGGGVMVNSKAADALSIARQGGITAERVRVTGGAKISPYASITPGVVTGVPPVADPLAGLPVPDPVALGLPSYPGVRASLDPLTGVQVTTVKSTLSDAATGVAEVGGELILKPGVYKGGIFSQDVPLVLEPGIYILDGGGMQLTGNASINGLGVMIYNTSYSSQPDYGPIVLDGNGRINISAPLSGPYKDMLFFQDRNNIWKAQLKAGSNITALNGTFYFPRADYTLKKDGSTLNLLATRFIVETMTLTGNGALNLNFAGQPLAGPGQVTLID